jgi:hypothetical protein
MKTGISISPVNPNKHAAGHVEAMHRKYKGLKPEDDQG